MRGNYRAIHFMRHNEIALCYAWMSRGQHTHLHINGERMWLFQMYRDHGVIFTSRSVKKKKSDAWRVLTILSLQSLSTQDHQEYSQETVAETVWLNNHKVLFYIKGLVHLNRISRQMQTFAWHQTGSFWTVTVVVSVLFCSITFTHLWSENSHSHAFVLGFRQCCNLSVPAY